MKNFTYIPDQRAGISTDCGNEMVTATSNGLFGPQYAYIAHVWNNIVKNSLCILSSCNLTKLVAFSYVKGKDKKT